MADFLMPSLGADMHAGTLVAWRKQPGDRIARGEIIAEVETEKGVIEVECFTEGVLETLLVSPGQKVPVGTRLAVVGEATEAQPPATATPARAVETVPQPSQIRISSPAPPTAPVHASPSVRRFLREREIDARTLHGTGREGTITHADALTREQLPPRQAMTAAIGARVPISPLARRMALEHGLDLTLLSSSGPGGYVVAQDVAQALRGRPTQEVKAAPPSLENPMRAAIAQAMARSKREIPHYYLGSTIDLGDTLAWLASENAKRAVPDRLLAGVLFVRAVAHALRKIPELNAHWVEGRYVPQAQVNVGVAVSLRGGGLVAPAIMAADTLSLDALSRAFNDAVTRARSGRLRSSEMTAATLTITSLGERGVETVYPIIMPPQVAMVGFGAIVDKPMAVAGAVVVRPTVHVSLAADHRVSDGHRGGLFLSAVQTLLQEPPTP